MNSQLQEVKNGRKHSCWTRAVIPAGRRLSFAGVFMDGSVGPGAVVGFWPGVSYEPSELSALPGLG